MSSDTIAMFVGPDHDKQNTYRRFQLTRYSNAESTVHKARLRFLGADGWTIVESWEWTHVSEDVAKALDLVRELYCLTPSMISFYPGAVPDEVEPETVMEDVGVASSVMNFNLVEEGWGLDRRRTEG